MHVVGQAAVDIAVEQHAHQTAEHRNVAATEEQQHFGRGRIAHRVRRQTEPAGRAACELRDDGAFAPARRLLPAAGWHRGRRRSPGRAALDGIRRADVLLRPQPSPADVPATLRKERRTPATAPAAVSTATACVRTGADAPSGNAEGRRRCRRSSGPTPPASIAPASAGSAAIAQPVIDHEHHQLRRRTEPPARLAHVRPVQLRRLRPHDVRPQLHRVHAPERENRLLAQGRMTLPLPLPSGPRQAIADLPDKSTRAIAEGDFAATLRALRHCANAKRCAGLAWMRAPAPSLPMQQRAGSRRPHARNSRTDRPAWPPLRHPAAIARSGERHRARSARRGRYSAAADR